MYLRIAEKTYSLALVIITYLKFNSFLRTVQSPFDYFGTILGNLNSFIVFS